MEEGGRASAHADAPDASIEAADLIVRCLEYIGVDHVFGIPGGAVEPLYNAFARSERRGGLRTVLCRHEAGAAFMADGYARETDRIGVCVATSGPGATNLITGIACAYDNGVPVLAITGQPALPSFGRRSFQESGCTGIDVVGMFRHCTGYNSLVSHADQLETKLVNALIRCHQLQRPAHLSIPLDVLRASLPDRPPAYDLGAVMKKPALVDERAVRELRSEILTAARLVFIVGSGAHDAIDALMALIDATGALFVCTPDGKGLVDTRHPAYRGVFGFAGHASASSLLRSRPDRIVAVGASMGEWNSGAWCETILNERLIHIDVSEERLMRTPMARLHVQGHIRAICERLAELLRDEGGVAVPAQPVDVGIPAESGDAGDDGAAPIKPQRLMAELSRRCLPSTRFLADTGNSTAWAVNRLEPPQSTAADTRPDHWLRVTMDFAPMGWAIGAAIGVARGNPARPVVCITGDGAVLMNGQEITVAASEGLSVLFVVLNDGALGMVKHGQRLSGAEPIAYTLPAVDFRRLAEAMGIPGHVVCSAADLDALDFAAILRHPGPTLLDVRIDGEEVPPMGVRLKTLR